MHYVILALVLAVLAIAAAACRPAEKPPPSGATAPAAAAAVSEVPVPGSREDVAARLATLARDPAPADLEMGAMCYKMAGPPDRAEYLCPACGEKTLYSSEEKTSRVSIEVPACQRLVAEIRDLAVRLDESEFCEKCRPGVAAPRLALVVRYPDGREQRTEDVGFEDLRLLVEFTSGARKHDKGQAGEKPLKDYLARLETLLGVTPAVK